MPSTLTIPLAIPASEVAARRDGRAADRTRRATIARTLAAVSRLASFSGLLILASASFAQPEKPKVTVTVFLVDELMACRPSGYANDDDRTGHSRCDPLSFEDLDAWEELGYEPILRGMPPEKVSLGRLIDAIDDYRKVCGPNHPCLTASERKAIVLALELEGGDEVSPQIHLARVPPPDSKIPAYETGGRLSPQGRWITHQRADVFLPAYNVRWVLRTTTMCGDSPCRWAIQTKP